MEIKKMSCGKAWILRSSFLDYARTSKLCTLYIFLKRIINLLYTKYFVSYFILLHSTVRWQNNMFFFCVVLQNEWEPQLLKHVNFFCSQNKLLLLICCYKECGKKQKQINVNCFIKVHKSQDILILQILRFSRS